MDGGNLKTPPETKWQLQSIVMMCCAVLPLFKKVCMAVFWGGYQFRGTW